MSKNVAGDVDQQPWTDAFEKRSTEGFEAALAPDVVLNASSLVKQRRGYFLARHPSTPPGRGSKRGSWRLVSTACIAGTCGGPTKE